MLINSLSKSVYAVAVFTPSTIFFLSSFCHHVTLLFYHMTGGMKNPWDSTAHASRHCTHASHKASWFLEKIRRKQLKKVESNVVRSHKPLRTKVVGPTLQIHSSNEVRTRKNDRTWRSISRRPQQVWWDANHERFGQHGSVCSPRNESNELTDGSAEQAH